MDYLTNRFDLQRMRQLFASIRDDAPTNARRPGARGGSGDRLSSSAA